MKKTIFYIILLLLCVSLVNAAGVVTRTGPSTATGSFQITYTPSGVSGQWGVSITDTVSGGCTFGSGSTTYSDVILSDGMTTRTMNVNVPSSGTCQFTGDYKFGTDPVQSMGSKTVTIGGSSCTDTSWTPDPSTICVGETFTQTSNCGNTRSAIGTKTCTSSGTGIVTRSAPTSSPGNFAVTYTPSGVSGQWGVSITDTVSGGCTFGSGSTTYSDVILSDGQTTRTMNVNAPASGTCQFTGDYKFGTNSVQQMSSSTVTIGGSACTPQCTGKVCGDDGCGGICGACNDGQTCSEGTCVSGGGGDTTTECFPYLQKRNPDTGLCVFDDNIIMMIFVVLILTRMF